MTRHPAQSDPTVDTVLASIAQAIRRLQFGEVHILVHDAKIVRIERIERIRVEAPAQSDRSAKGGPG